MYKVKVYMTDMYSNASFEMFVSELNATHLTESIENLFDKWSNKLSRVGAGVVDVLHKGKRIAYGSICWLYAGHSLVLADTSLDSVRASSAKVQDARRSVSPSGCPKRARNSPTCCALV